jgi:hypothetical protein
LRTLLAFKPQRKKISIQQHEAIRSDGGGDDGSNGNEDYQQLDESEVK